MRSRTNYILGIYSCLFQNVAVRDASHNTDHYLVLGCFRGAAPAAHLHYLGRHTCFPIRPLETLDKIYRIFSELRWSIPRSLLQECHRQACISPETWSLIDTRIAARRRKYQRSSRSLSCEIKAGIQEDRRRRAAESGSEVESLLASNPPLIIEAWIRMWG